MHRRMSELGLVTLVVGAVAVADTAWAVTFQCGDGTPSASTGKCDCPAGKAEKTSGGVSRCEAAFVQCALGKRRDATGKCVAVAAPVVSATPKVKPTCPTGSAWVEGTGCVGTVVCPAPSHFVAGAGCVTGSMLGQACGAATGKGDFSGVAPGTRVVLGRHRAVDGDDNWAAAMDGYVGLTGKVTELSDVDSAGCACLKVDADGGSYFWRVRDLKLAPKSYPQECGQLKGSADYGVEIGWQVVLGKHRPVDGDTYWSADMDKFVGQTTTVEELASVDPKGCPLVRVAADKKAYYWRVRDLAPATSAAAPVVASSTPPDASVSSDLPQACGETKAAAVYGLVVGAPVILGKHRPVSGDTYWSEDMTKFVGKSTTVADLAGVDPKGCPIVHVEVDSKAFYWRVRDLQRGPGDFTQACGLKGAGADFAGLRVGDAVILERHRVVDGDDNWAPAMDGYVGKTAHVSSLGPADAQGCPFVHIDADSGTYQWRLRDLRRASGTSASFAGTSSTEWPSGAASSFGTWTFERSSDGTQAHIYTPGGATAVELVAASNGWFRLRKGGSEKVVFSSARSEPQPFATRPWSSTSASGVLSAGTVWSMSSGASTTTLKIDASIWRVTLPDGATLSGDFFGALFYNGKPL